MIYKDFVKELIDRFGEDKGVAMALRAEVGFLRKFIEKQEFPNFNEEEEMMIEDFLTRHPKQ